MFSSSLYNSSASKKDHRVVHVAGRITGFLEFTHNSYVTSYSQSNDAVGCEEEEGGRGDDGRRVKSILEAGDKTSSSNWTAGGGATETGTSSEATALAAAALEALTFLVAAFDGFFFAGVVLVVREGGEGSSLLQGF